jgi:hypothetical protein
MLNKELNSAFSNTYVYADICLLEVKVQYLKKYPARQEARIVQQQFVLIAQLMGIKQKQSV